MGLAFLILPVATFLATAPWSRLGDLVGSASVRSALWLSVTTSSIATVLVALLGLPLAWLLSRDGLPGRDVVRGLVVLPLVLPPVAGGLALSSLLGDDGVVGSVLAGWGMSVQGTTVAVVLSQAFVGLPFLVLSAEGALRGVDREFDEVTWTLGAGSWKVFRHVALPIATPGIIAGLVLAWARAIGEFGATATFAGKVPGATQTLPLELYRVLETDRDGAVAVGMVLVALSLAVVLTLRSRWMSTL